MKYFSVFLLAAATVFGADFVTGQAARALIGQRFFTAQEAGASESLLGGVGGLAYANDTLFVVDSNRLQAAPVNNRVLIFNNISRSVPLPTSELTEFTRCPVCTGAADVVVGQPDFQKNGIALTAAGLRSPNAVASDGRYLAIADTDNNRVVIWNRIPTTNGTPADVVIGQPDFTKNGLPAGNVPNNKSMRGPQGVWIQNGKLYVADTQNNRVLIYNSIPTSNGAAADVVLGQPDFNTFVQVDLTQAKVDAKANNMLNPVSVTSDGQRLYVADLGHNRVLIWNSLPASNQAPADFALGQPDLTSAINNNSSKLCPANGKNDKGEDTFPARCSATLDFPRFALSDGKRLFVADGGNDRVLGYNSIPTQSGQSPDFILGQTSGEVIRASDAADSLRTPTSLAWDGMNLYVTDTFNRRIMIYSPAEFRVPLTAVRNAASREIFAVGSVNFSGAIKENDEVTIKIKDTEYKYKIVKDDTFAKVIDALTALINKSPGDPNVFASRNPVIQGIILTARIPGEAGNDISYSVTPSSGATITASTGGATLQGGQDAAKIAPGTIVSIFGTDLSDFTGTYPSDRDVLPTTLGDVQVYFDGIRAPLFLVSPTQINAQVPFHVNDATSINAYVRTKRLDGSVTVTTPVAVTIVPENPGIFAGEGTDPRPGRVFHGTSNASGSVSVDGSVKAGDVATISIEDRPYTYTVQSSDTLESIRNALVDAINANADEKVTASPAGVFTRVILKAKIPGAEGNGIAYSAKANDGSQVILSPSGPALCCANSGPVTEDNPAVPGETIIVYATGLGLVNPSQDVRTGEKYKGPVTQPNEFVSSIAGGKTANVLFAGLAQNMVGVYEVQLELNSDIPTNPLTQLTIAQNVYVSNIITFAVVNPKPPETP